MYLSFTIKRNARHGNCSLLFVLLLPRFSTPTPCARIAAFLKHTEYLHLKLKLSLLGSGFPQQILKKHIVNFIALHLNIFYLRHRFYQTLTCIIIMFDCDADACVYNGRSYGQGQQWQDGCQYNCQCLNATTGYYKCTERSVTLYSKSVHCS